MTIPPPSGAPPVSKPPRRVLLTVPQVRSTTSPYREMMALARRLPRDEFQLTVCGLRNNGVDETGPILRELGVDLFVARFRPRRYHPKAIWQSLRDQAVIRDHGPFDLVHSMDFSASPFEAVMARRRGWPFLFSQRNLNPGGRDWLLRLRSRLAVGGIAISESTRDLLLRTGIPPDRLTLAYPGLNLAEFDRRAEEPLDSETARLLGDAPGLVLTVGHIIPLKRQLDAVEALALLWKTVPGARLAIAGEPVDKEYVARLQGRIQELRLKDAVLFLGSRSDVPALMRRADVTLSCSGSEAFGWVVVESMAAGTPVVSSAVEGPKEILQHEVTGFLAVPGDIEGYAAALQRLLTDPELGKSMAHRARQVVERRYTDESMAEAIAAAYRRVLG